MQAKRFKKWEKELNICIRCGYCYEHCHLFKLSKWEADSPRGKLLLLYGLIAGEIELSPAIAEKIFQCFYCGRCEESCSANVPVRDIFTDAKTELLEAGFDPEGTIISIDEDRCSKCGLCISVCKTEALTFEGEGENKKVVIDKVKCESCGLCIATCPSEAVTQKEGFEVTRKELLAKATRFLEEQKNGKPKIVVFSCNWSTYPGLQLSQLPIQEKNTAPILMSMCIGRVDPRLIIELLCRGAWGVLVAGCPPEECQHNGNYKARRRILLLKNMLKQFNIESQRLELESVAPGESAKLAQAMNNFAEAITKLGPIN